MSTNEGSEIRVSAYRGLRLTPAASEKLEQKIEDLRAQILREIERQYSDPDRRVKVSDIDTAVGRIRVLSPASKYSSLVTFGSALSACTILIQIIVLAVSSKLMHFSGAPLLAGISAGTAATGTTLLLAQELRRSRRLMSASRSEFIRAFVRVEDRMRINAQELLGSAAKSASLGRIISAIELLQLWAPEDSCTFRHLLGIRNSIVHEDNRNISAEKITEAISEISRLYRLLENDASSRVGRRVKEVTENTVALSYEELVANALRKAHLEVSVARKDAGYDLLAGRCDSLKKVVVKYRSSGLLTVNDVSGVADQSSSTIGTVIVTNAKTSPNVLEYLDLEKWYFKNQTDIEIVSWRDGDDISPLVRAIISENADRGRQ